MGAFLRLVTRGRTQAVVTSTAVLVLLPPFFFVSGGVIGLATLRYGPAEGALVLGATAVAAAGLMLALFGAADPVLAFLGFLGLPVWALATVLRWSTSQGVMLTAAGLLGALVYLSLHLLHGEPAAFWRGTLERLTIDRADADPRAAEVFGDLLDRLEPALAGLPTGIVVCAVLVTLLARWWHAILDNPGGFGSEFRSLRVDRRVAWAAVAIAAWAVFAGGAASGLGAELMQLVVAIYMIQGVAVVHALVSAHKAPKGWLGLMYLLLLLVSPLATLVLAVCGLSDTWVDYRKRYGTGTA